MGRARGFTLASTILMISLSMVLAFSLAASGVFHLFVSTVTANQRTANNLAETAVSNAVAALMQNQTFGKGGESLTITPPDARPGWGATLKFANTPGLGAGEPYSTYNLFQPQSTQGYLNQMVPKDGVDLVGVGRWGDAYARVEGIVILPPFPYSIAATGPVLSNGGLLVAGAGNGPANDTNPNDLLPGSMASNATTAPAIAIGPQSIITGDVLACGSIQLDAGAVVKGAVVPKHDPVVIPTVDIAALDPVTMGRTDIQTLPNSLPGGKLTGFCRCAGPLTVTGDLDMNGAVLYVDGDLAIHGEVTGVGALISTATTSIQGGVNLTADNQAALISQGNVTIQGVSGQKDSTFFRGLVYTKGNFNASDVSLFGVFVANSAVPGGGSMSLNNCNVVLVPNLSTINVSMASTSTTTGTFTFPFTVDDDQSNGLWLEFEYKNDGTYSSPNPIAYPEGQQYVITAQAYQLNGQVMYDVQNPVTGQWVKQLDHNAAQQQICAFARQIGGRPLAGDPGVPSPAGWGNRSGFVAIGAWMTLQVEPKAPPATVQQGGTGTTTSNTGLFTFDLNKFINPADQMRMVLWRHL